ncbi:Crp/Fnr family transcriptional regulator [Thioalkalivibrio sp.]|uniref:Crp/Fnr family transcriptional regulator n=1 Tax=Thioalkalivibrio sp. TaxID=2093813 RepID=UPI003565F6C9
MTPMNMALGKKAGGGKAGDPSRRLAEIAGRLPQEQQRTLLQFAEFLLAQVPEGEAAPLPEPKEIPRPEQESVIKAMRRLSETYHMLERGPLLNETSALMGQHVMQGRPAAEVIDELEVIFARHYEKVRSSS